MFSHFERISPQNVPVGTSVDYVLIDTDFETPLFEARGSEALDLTRQVIRVYNNKKLPVIPNLKLCILWLHQHIYTGAPIKTILRWNAYLNNEYKPYAREMDKWADKLMVLA
jgi:hypothetical protein